MTTAAAGGPAPGVVLCVGEPLIALTPAAATGLQHTDTLSVAVGGAEVNVAVGLAQLGVPSRFAGRVGDDPFGRKVSAVLTAAGVDARFLEVDPGRPTGLYLKDPAGPVRYYRKDSAASVLAHLPEPARDGVGHVHLTGITAALSPQCRDLVARLLSAPGATASFDVNYRPALWHPAVAGPVLLALAARADIVLAGLDEAALLWDVHEPEDIRALLPDVGELIVKDGPRRASAFRGADRVDVPPLPAPVVEPIGAGDAFAAGYLAARRGGATLAAALRTGHLLAAIVIGGHTDHGRAPTARELDLARTGTGWPAAD
ncbi:sugar kinase [Nocardia sp. BMG111209]|uniref:sugar kinase n=1 Tax=Nocardia sp. BMG111209 TaxID=1160137 RepID=UPI000362AE4B|nr:sugar kinase [Nocardia sp. BMG111209]